MTLTAIRRYVAMTVLGGILCGAAAGDARAAGVGVPPVAARAVATESEGSQASTTRRAADVFDDYARREQQAPQAGQFRGGHAGIYIGGSGVALVLLIVLLVILL
jgi:hypothetical protein